MDGDGAVWLEEVGADALWKLIHSGHIFAKHANTLNWAIVINIYKLNIQYEMHNFSNWRILCRE